MSKRCRFAIAVGFAVMLTGFAVSFLTLLLMKKEGQK